VGLEFASRSKPGDTEEQSWLVTYYPIKACESTAVSAIGVIVQDVTARRRSEEALRASELREREARGQAEQAMALLDTFLEASPVGVALLDQDLRYIRINKALAAVHGRDPDGIVGQTVHTVLMPDIAASVERAMRSVLESGRPLVGLELRGRAR